MEIQEVIRNYLKNLYCKKLKNLEEIDKFLDSYDLPKLNQEDINPLNRFITRNKTKEAIKSPKKKSSGLDRFSAEFYQTFKKEY
jgi:hypothetical protein